MVVVAHQAAGLQVVNELILLLQLPVEGDGIHVVVPPAVEPDGPDLAVVGEQLGQLVVHEAIVCRPVGAVEPLGPPARTACGIVLAGPVDVRVIEVQLDALAVTLLGQLPHDVFAVGRIHDVIVRPPGIPHGEALVMPGGETDVFRPRSLEGRHPLAGIETVGIKAVHGLGIFAGVDTGIVHIPLTLCKGAVQAPVDKDTQPALGKLFPVLKILGGRYILLGLRRHRQQAEACKRCNPFFHRFLFLVFHVYQVDAGKGPDTHTNVRKICGKHTPEAQKSIPPRAQKQPRGYPPAWREGGPSVSPVYLEPFICSVPTRAQSCHPRS